MAFETVEVKYRKATATPVGESVTGYVLGQNNSGQYPEHDNIHMQDKMTGEKFVLSTAGNLKYFFKNGNKPGYLYRFTRKEDIKNKRGQTSSSWTIERDSTDTMPEVLNAALQITQTAPKATVTAEEEQKLQNLPF